MTDLYGEELARWKHVEEVIHGCLASFGYSEIRTPVLEKFEVFSQSVGEASDIVEKQMYTLTDLSKDVLALRPEGTASFVRAIVEHGLFRVGVQRFYYYLPMFRHERPQKGRLRQFHQFGAELICDCSPEADAELVALANHIFRTVGVRQFTTRVNSVGCQKCRTPYREELKKYLQSRMDSLCELCRARMERAPMRVLDCKNPDCTKIAIQAPKISERLCDECRTHHEQVKACLGKLGVAFDEDPRIVRGLDYYVRTAFELNSTLLGAQDALGGGGRYDGLSERFGCESFPGVGFAIGVERVLLALGSGLSVPKGEHAVFLAPIGDEAYDYCFDLLFRLRRQGTRAQMLYDRSKPLKALLKQSDRHGCLWTVVIGGDELAAGAAIVKDMTTGNQVEVAISQLESYWKGKSEA
jgi:histidyl-tRNA synthetase